MLYKGQKIHKTPGELNKAIEELKVTCQSEGVDISQAEFPDKALTYNPLIEKLEKLGILSTLSLPGLSPTSCSSTEAAQANLRQVHVDNVSNNLK